MTLRILDRWLTVRSIQAFETLRQKALDEACKFESSFFVTKVKTSCGYRPEVIDISDVIWPTRIFFVATSAWLEEVKQLQVTLFTIFEPDADVRKRRRRARRLFP